LVEKVKTPSLFGGSIVNPKDSAVTKPSIARNTATSRPHDTAVAVTKWFGCPKKYDEMDALERRDFDRINAKIEKCELKFVKKNIYLSRKQTRK
jgi:hypothetical protein